MFSFSRSIDAPFDAVQQRVRDALADEGFGVLTEIDVAATMKKKLDADMAPYVILGACNPQLAHRAISHDPEIGALLPCNVVVRDGGADGTIVSFMDPQAVLGLMNDAAIEPIAADVRARMERVADAVAAG